jgi:argininosuccinate synthase
MQMANEIAGRNGIGMRNALENRIIGTKSRGVYEAPGMELLGFCLSQVYQAVMNRDATLLFQHLSKLVADQVYDGRYFDPATAAAQAAIDVLAEPASGTVTVALYKGNILFNSLTDCAGSIYNEEDSSMEASEGLNPESSQGFAEIQSVEARSLAKAGQINA